MEFDVALAVGEREIEGALRTCKLPLAQDRDDDRGEGDRALPSLGFRRADGAKRSAHCRT